MAVFNEPTQWDHTLGNNADISTLPDDAAATAGIASLQKLFQIINATPLEAGGIAPGREDVNALFKYLGDSIFYTMNGGVPSYNSSYDYVEGRVVVYTDGNLYKCIQANTSADPKAPTDSAYWSKIPTLADIDEIGFKTGDIKIQTTSTIPAGWLLCNGAGVSRSTFSNLFTKIGTTYGTGDGSTTFNIPDLRDRYIIGANTNALGTYIAEQLPNIYGKISNDDYTGFQAFGETRKSHTTVTGGMLATYSEQSGVADQGSNVACLRSIEFNAYYSNSIYTGGGKVYPASIALNFIIKT